MWKTMTVVAILISVVSLVLAAQAVRSRDEAVRVALKQHEAEIVARYAPFVRNILAQGGRDKIVVVNPKTLDDLFAALAEASRQSPETAAAADATREAIASELTMKPEDRRETPVEPIDPDRAVMNVKRGGVAAAPDSGLRESSVSDTGTSDVVLHGEIAFAARDGKGRTNIYRLTLPASLPHVWTEMKWDGSLPVWPPPESWHIAKVADRDGQKDVFLFFTPEDEDAWRRLTETPAVESSLTWSPSGEYLAFEVTGGGETGIRVADIWKGADANGEAPPQKPEDLFLLSKNGRLPAWSPDGLHIAYTRRPYNETSGPYDEIVVVKPDGKDETVVWRSELASESPKPDSGLHVRGMHWLPGSRVLLVSVLHMRDNGSQQTSRFEVLRVDVERRTTDVIKMPEGFLDVLAVTPDGRHFLYSANDTHIPSGSLHAYRLSDGQHAALLDTNYHVIAATWVGPRLASSK